MGILLVLVGGVGTAIAALADSLGLSINADGTFGWLQILGVIVGAVVVLLGLVIASQAVPLPWGSAGGSAGTTAAPQTTVVTGSSRRRSSTV